MCHECHCAMPTDFGIPFYISCIFISPVYSDCCLGYGLAHVAGALIGGGYTGYVACLQNLNKPVKGERWVKRNSQSHSKYANQFEYHLFIHYFSIIRMETVGSSAPFFSWSLRGSETLIR